MKLRLRILTAPALDSEERMLVFRIRHDGLGTNSMPPIYPQSIALRIHFFPIASRLEGIAIGLQAIY